MELVTGENDEGRRLDRVLRKALPEHSLALIHRLLRQGFVFVNGKSAKAQYRLKNKDVISIPSLKEPRSFLSPLPVACSLMPDILWQGQGLIAVNKPSGITVHGKNSLDEIVRAYLADKVSPSLSFKPGPLHRLDKPSSGIVVFSTNIEGARSFSELMRERKVKKTYLAVLEGAIDCEEVWEDKLVRNKTMKKTFVSSGGKMAITKITPLKSMNKNTLVMAEITTGRTHQIRAQAAAAGHPLAGDRKYGSVATFGKGGFFLHAWKLEFRDVESSLDVLLEAPVPAAFAGVLGKPPCPVFDNLVSCS